MTARTLDRAAWPGRARRARTADPGRVDQVPHRARLGDRPDRRRGADGLRRAVRGGQRLQQLQPGHRRRLPAVRPDRAGRRGRVRQLLPSRPAAGRERQPHRPGRRDDRPGVRRSGQSPARPAARSEHGQRPDAVVEDRDHYHGQHSSGGGVRGHDGHRRTRRADAVRLRERPARPGRRGHRGVAALAAADPGLAARSPATTRPTAGAGSSSAPPGSPGCPAPCRPGCSPPRRSAPW